MAKDKYYNGQKLLDMLDINGQKPEIYICTTNRNAGKTTFFNRKMINDFKKKGMKFALIVRYMSDIADCVNSFWKDISYLFFPGDDLKQENRQNGKYAELFLNEVSCGYVIPIMKPEKIKKVSAEFSDVGQMLFDEFQLESGMYLKDEPGQLYSIHTSVARGRNEQVRYVPLYLVGNTISILNPYYIQYGIARRLKSDTKFLRGDGFVLEQGFNESASEAQLASGFSRAMQAGGMSKQVAYAAQGVYLNDNQAFIEKPQGRSRYIVTLHYEGHNIGIRLYPDAGIVYADNSADMTFPYKVTVKSEDHNVNYVMLRTNSQLLFSLRWYFDRGCFRFKDLLCKDCILTALSL